MTRLIKLIGLTVALVLGFQTAASASNCHHQEYTPVEVSVCWQMTNPDLTNPASFEWPQTFVAEGDASATPEGLCGVPVGCDTQAKFQFDQYWIRDQKDRDHLDAIEASGMTSSADDASLEPHNYSALIVNSDQSTCPPPPPHHPKKHYGYIKYGKYPSCKLSQRDVVVKDRKGIAHLRMHHSKNREHWSIRIMMKPHWFIKAGPRGEGPWVHHVTQFIKLHHYGPCGTPPVGSGRTA